ncbi:MAG: CDP-diacylglycerol--glycerol-3-phosphate 3-phosphatidyltransferase [Syntrophales bacterium]|jgi:cardiolipin synthase
MNIPNLLTIIRIILVPLIVILLMDGAYVKALLVFIMAGLTDALDGFLARVLLQKTALGGYLDPIADKILIGSCFTTLAIMGILPGWLAVVIISRDVIIILGICILTIMGISYEIKPVFVSKVTTTLQIITVFAVLTLKCLPGIFTPLWIHGLFWISAVFTMVSGMDYMIIWIKMINHQS